MPSLRDFEQNHRRAKADGNSSRYAKNLRISSAEGHGENLKSSVSARALNQFSRFSEFSVLFVVPVLSLAGIDRFDRV